MCNFKQTPQSNWWPNDSKWPCDTTGLGMDLQPQQPPEKGTDTSHSLPSRGMLQYLPFSLCDKLPVALDSTHLKPLLHRGASSSTQDSSTSTRLSHVKPPRGEDGGRLLSRQGPANKNCHAVTRLRAVLPPASEGTSAAPAGPRRMGKTPWRGSSGAGCWSRFKTTALSWSLSLRANVSLLLCPSSPLAPMTACSALSSSRRVHTHSARRQEPPPAKQIF